MARNHSKSPNSPIDRAVEQALGQAMAAVLPQIQADVVRELRGALSAIPDEVGGKATAGAVSLLPAVHAIHAGTTQKEILRSLLEACGPFCSRIALFVVKAGAASGWQGRGFGDDDAIKDFPLDPDCGPVAHALLQRVPAAANIAEMDHKFARQFGAPSDEQILIVPLRLKEKVAALVYADGGSSGTLDSASLELLVAVAGTWLEVVSLRKQSLREEAETETGQPNPSSSQSTVAPPDPFSGHAPKHAWPMTPAETISESAPEPEAPVVELPAAHAASASAAAAAPAIDALAALSPEDADTHRKAQRFARLLVDEIKLYNQAKVVEGRKNRDLYDRLKEDIEKSRATYQKRFGATAASSADYFQREVVRNLGEEDVSVMGATFRP